MVLKLNKFCVVLQRFERDVTEHEKEKERFDGASKFPRLALRDCLPRISRPGIYEGCSGITPPLDFKISRIDVRLEFTNSDDD